MATPEGKVKDRIKRWVAKNIPATWMFMPVSAGYGKHGIPDFIMCVPKVVTEDMVGKTIGMFVGIEAKAAGGKLSKYQAVQIEEIREAAGVAFVIKGTPDEATAQMDAIGDVCLK